MFEVKKYEKKELKEKEMKSTCYYTTCQDGVIITLILLESDYKTSIWSIEVLIGREERFKTVVSCDFKIKKSEIDEKIRSLPVINLASVNAL